MDRFIKPYSCFFLLLCFVTTKAQDKQLEDAAASPAITATGTAVGKAASSKLDKNGGSITSTDGRVQLNIPAGSLSKKTTISIQPITNLLPNGNGPAYRLEPSGIQFKKPVELIFYYGEEEAYDNKALFSTIAMQDANGLWHKLQASRVDTVARTIAGFINHFSDWGNFEEIKLYPTSLRLKVKKTAAMQIDLVSSEEDELVPLNADELVPLSKKKIPWTSVWKANEIVNGNSVVGAIKQATQTYSIYTAPATVPDKNPVAVTADLKGLTYKYKGVALKDLTLVSNITVYDKAFEVKMVCSMSDDKCTYNDAGSFVVELNGKKSRIIEKLNNNTQAQLGYNSDCTIVTLKPGWGNIHVTKAQSIKVIPGAGKDDVAWVEISFPFIPTVPPLLQFSCPDLTGKTFTSTNAMANGIMKNIPAFPISLSPLRFKAIEGEQVIQEIGKEGTEMWYKCSVKELKDE